MSQQRRAAGRGRFADERGVTATELAVLMPVLILLVLLPIQVGLWWHAKQAAEVAAEQAVNAAASANATSADGRHGAASILGQAGNLRDVTVSVTRTGTAVVVDVHGELGFSLFPGPWQVNAHAEGPIERFVPENER